MSRLSDIQIEEINEFSKLIQDIFVEQASRDIGAFIEVERKKEDGSAIFLGVSDFIGPSSEIFVGGNFTTTAEVSRMQKSSACPWCGNSSGETDSRGMCVSCGGNLGG